MRIEWRSKARADMLDIARHISLDIPAGAKTVLEEISRQTLALQDHPQLGRSGRIRGTRELVVAHTAYIVVYRLTTEVVRIHRVLHGARKWPTTL